MVNLFDFDSDKVKQTKQKNHQEWVFSALCSTRVNYALGVLKE